MESLSLDRLESLEKSRINWKIKVRVTRMWPTVSSDSGTTKGFNLILLDDDNTHVHAFAYVDVWEAIGKDVVEGAVYVIQTFSVRDAVGNLKPVSSKICIRFMRDTKFEPIHDDSMIPSHKFEFLDLGDLFAEASRLEPNENPEYATDVIGVLEDFEELKKISTKYGDRNIVRFRLCDGSFRHRVGVWGELAKYVQGEYSQVLEKPVIAILTSTKLTTYKNSVQIGTLPSSKVYFNLKDESVMDMRQRLEEEGYKSSQNVDESSYALTIVSPYLKVSLKDLNDNISELLKMQKKIFCTFTIAKVEDDTIWWFNACNLCHDQVFRIERKFKCVTCSRNMPVAEKRFRIKVIAEDSTFSCTVLLMDRVVKRMIGTTASKLLQDLSQVQHITTTFPTLLTNMAGNEITVNIDVIESGGKEDGLLYQAVDFYDSSTTNTSTAESSSPLHFPAITFTESLDDSEASKTPGSAKSVNKKIKKEK